MTLKMISVQRIIKQPILLFTASRYTSYGLQILRGILIAKYLGPYLFGVWGFLTLIQQYLSYTSFGLQYAITVKLSTSQTKDHQKQEKLNIASFSATIIVAIFLGLIGLIIQVFDIALFEKYSFSQYALMLGIITGFTHLNQVFTNIYRVHNRLFKIAISEIVTATILVLVVLFFRGNTLISALLIAMILSGIFSIGLFLYHSPFKISLSLELEPIYELLIIAIPLLIYNISAYLIMASARTVLSVFYSVETMGYYSLANSITNSTLLGLKSIAWVMFPTILSKTHDGVINEYAKKTVEKVNNFYGTSVLLVVLIIILLLPVLFWVLPQYKPTEGTINVLLLSQAILSASFGYNSIAIARKEQLKVARISLIAVIIVTTLSLFVSMIDIHFVWVGVSVLVGSVVYTLLQAHLGSQIIGLDTSNFDYIRKVLPPGNIIAILFSIIGSFLDYALIYNVIGLTIFSFSNRKKLASIYSYILNKTLS